MSITEPSAEPVQPEAGQGSEGAGGSPWADLLDRIPEESRGDFENRFREWDANYTRTSQAHAEYEKTWKPYADAGVSQYDPQDIQAAFQLLQDPQAARQWLDQQYGPVAAPEAPQDPYGGFEDPSQQQLEQLLESKLGPIAQQMEQIAQWRQEQEQRALHDQVDRQIAQAIDDLKAKEIDKLPEPLREQFDELIDRFGSKYAEPGADPKQVVAQAWQDILNYVNAIEKSVLQSKANAPAPAEGGGVADVTPQKITRVKDVSEAAVEFLRQNNRM